MGKVVEKIDLDLDLDLDLEGLVHEGSKDLLKYIKLEWWK